MRTTLKQIEWNSGINKVEELLHQVLSEVADQLNLRQGSFLASTAVAAARYVPVLLSILSQFG